MNILVKILLAGLFITCCSCSWFSKKPPEVNSQVSLPNTPQASLPNTSQVYQPGNVSVTVPQSAQTPAVTDIAKVESSKVTYKKDDMTFVLKADAQLNRYQNNAHTLFLCIYQLKDPNAFNQLAEDKNGLPKLLECSRFDSSVANAKRLVMQPGQEIKDVRDRAEGARFIGIATGYFGTGKERVTHLAPLSVTRGDFSNNTIQVDLGPYEIDNVTVK